MKSISRREVLLSMAAVPALAQSAKRQLPIASLSHVTMSVSDPKRSIAFYQNLFGLPIQAYQGPNDSAPPSMRVGSGPQFLFVSGIRGGGKPGIDHFCFTTPNFSVDRVTAVLGDHGISKAEAPGGGMTGGPLKFRIRIRDERTGGAKEGTPEFYIGDPDGLSVQLQDTTYCGGSGPMGEVCLNPVVAPPSKGSIAVTDFASITLEVPDLARSTAFYRDLFAVPKGSLNLQQASAPRIASFTLKARNLDPAAIKAAGGSVTVSEGNMLRFQDPDGIAIQLVRA